MAMELFIQGMYAWFYNLSQPAVNVFPVTV